jgi:hypothetical protein
MNQHEKAMAMKARTIGTGMYLMKNTTKADIMLPKISADGKSIIGPGQCFRGDSYLREQMRGSISVIEDLSNAGKESLILEQPPTITSTGEVKSQVKQNEQMSGKDVLLVEAPVSGVTIL